MDKLKVHEIIFLFTRWDLTVSFNIEAGYTITLGFLQK